MNTENLQTLHLPRPIGSLDLAELRKETRNQIQRALQVIHLSPQAQVSPHKREKVRKAEKDMERRFFSPNTSQHHFWVRHCTIRRLASERQQCCRTSKSIRNRTKLFVHFHHSRSRETRIGVVKRQNQSGQHTNKMSRSFHSFAFFCHFSGTMHCSAQLAGPNLSWQPWLIPTMWNTLPAAWSLKLAAIVQAPKSILKCDIKILNDRVQTSPSFKKDKTLVRTMHSTQVKSNTATTASDGFFLECKGSDSWVRRAWCHDCGRLRLPEAANPIISSFCDFLELCLLRVFCGEMYFVCWRMKKHACRNYCSIVTPALGSKIYSHSQYVMHTPCMIESNCQYVDVNVSNCTLTGTLDSKWTCGFVEVITAQRSRESCWLSGG